MTGLPAIILEILPLNNCLESLFCEKNQLTQMPELKSSLTYLYCENNQFPFKISNGGYLLHEKINEFNLNSINSTATADVIISIIEDEIVFVLDKSGNFRYYQCG